MAKILFRVFIKGEVRSSKNSSILTVANGKPRKMQSKAAMGYVNLTCDQWMQHAPAFREAAKDLPRPLTVAFEWTRGTKGTFDHTGPLEMVLDCMTGKKFHAIGRKMGMADFDKLCAWIEDDDVGSITPLVTPGYFYDKENPGVWITLLDGFPPLFT